jgi:hypothetical protein
MKRIRVYGLIAGFSLLTAAPVLAQTPAPQPQQPQVPANLTIPTALVERMATDIQRMATYMGGTAATDSQGILADLQGVINQQLPHPAAEPAPVAAAPTVTPPAVAKEALKKPVVSTEHH